MNLRKAGFAGELARINETLYPIRKTNQVLKAGGQGKSLFLPGEDPLGMFREPVTTTGIL